MRIVHVVSSLQVGGMEQFVLQLARWQQCQGHSVVVLALRGGPLEQRAADLEVRTIVLGGRGKLVRVLRALAVWARLRPRIVNAHNPSALTYALLARICPGARILMTRHGQKATIRLPGPVKLSMTHAIIAVSKAAAVAFKEQRPGSAGKVVVIRNGIEPRPPDQDRESVRKDLALVDGVVGITVARMDPLKGHDTLIRALASMDTEDRFCMLIVGDGTERARMEALATELGVGPGRVRFLGFRSDVPDLLAASDVFVLPSLAEGLPLSVLEAMAQGLPVVATPVGGVPEIIIGEELGILIPVQDPAALAHAITRLVKDPDLRARMGRAGREHILREFTFSEMAQKYLDLYNLLLEGKRSGHRFAPQCREGHA